MSPADYVSVIVGLIGILSAYNTFMLHLIFRRLDRMEDKFQTKEMCEHLHREAMARV